MAQDIQLRELHQKVIRKRTLCEELLILQAKMLELNSKVRDLEKRKLVEQKDVDRLEKPGISSFFYSVIGRKDEKLEKERTEARDAIQQYEEAFLELESVNRSIELKETELATLEGYEEKFEKLLQGKRRLMENSGTEAEQRVLGAEQELALQKEKDALFVETQKFGEQILENIKKVQETLQEAEKYVIAESASGMAMGIRKSELLSQAQKQTAALQPMLKAFGEKVERVTKEIQIHGNMNEVYKFGDGIYTSYIAAESVLQVTAIERIRTAKGELILLKEQIEGAVAVIAVEKEHNKNKVAFNKEKLENLIIGA